MTFVSLKGNITGATSGAGSPNAHPGFVKSL